MKRYLSAGEAAAMLGVSKAMLYAYVNRGLILSQEANSRARRYLAEDVQKLSERKAYRRNPPQVAQDALYWGRSVLDSALTLITDAAQLFEQTRARAAVVYAGCPCADAGAPFLPINALFDFVPLPFTTMLLLVGIAMLYEVTTEIIKCRFFRWMMPLARQNIK